MCIIKNKIGIRAVNLFAFLFNTVHIVPVKTNKKYAPHINAAKYQHLKSAMIVVKTIPRINPNGIK